VQDRAAGVVAGQPVVETPRPTGTVELAPAHRSAGETLGDDVQLGRETRQLRVVAVVTGGPLEVEQRLGRLGIAVDQRTGQQIGEQPDPVDPPDPGRPTGEQRHDGRLVEPAGQRVVVAGPAGRVVQDAPRFAEPAGQCPGQHGAEALRDEQAEQPSRAQRGKGVVDRGGRVVDVLQDAVAEHQVGAGGADRRHDLAGVSLLGVDPVGDACLGRTALQRGERVRAGVEHHDPVPQPGDRDGETAGATADVHDVELPTARGGPLGDQRVEGVPDDGGPDRRARVAAQGPPAGSGGVRGHGRSPGMWPPGRRQDGVESTLVSVGRSAPSAPRGTCVLLPPAASCCPIPPLTARCCRDSRARVCAAARRACDAPAPQGRAGRAGHFHPQELLRVWRLAVPGAVGQSLVAGLAGWGLARWFGWSDAAGLVFGMALAVASTVVLMRMLVERGRLSAPDGHAAVGWLIVEDLFTVAALVVLPVLAAPAGQGSVGAALGLALLKVGVFAGLVALAGTRLVSRLLERVARTRSAELFTLSVFVVALGIAALAAEVFHVSVALGAFFGGLLVGQSRFGPQAAADMAPFRDVFSALFFVSVGMLFDPGFVLREPRIVLGVLAVVLVLKPLVAWGIVRALRENTRAAATVAVGLAQIGEFSFILASLGVSSGVLPAPAMDALVVGAIVSIAINPLLFRAADRLLARQADVAVPVLPAQPRSMTPS